MQTKLLFTLLLDWTSPLNGCLTLTPITPKPALVTET